MKKAVAFISMVLCMALVITGCGGTKTGKDGGTGNQGNTGGNKTTKKIQWIMPSNAEQLKGYQGLVDKFNKEKSYDMEVLGTSYGDIFPKLQAMMAAKQVPDVNQFGTEMVPWASKGAMTPIDDYVKNSGMDLSKYDSKMVDAVTWDGKLWEVPYSSSTCVLYYNKDIFDKAGLDYPTHDWNDTNWTTDAFIELAQKLTIDKNGKNAAEDGFDPDNIVQYGVGGMQAMWFAPWYFGGDITDQTGTTYTGNDENTAKGIQFFADLSLKYHVMPTAEQSQALSAGGNIFLTGKVAMNVDGTWGATTMKDASFNWDIAATPIGTNHSVVLYTDGLGVGGNSQNPDGGWEFINWLNSSDENYLDFLKSTSGYMTIPSKLDTRDKVKSLLQEQFPDVDIDVMFNAVSVEDAKPVYMRYSENWNKLSSLLENEVYSVVNNGEKTAQQALSDVAKEAQDILDGK